MNEDGKRILDELFGRPGDKKGQAVSFFKTPKKVEKKVEEPRNRVNEFESEGDFILSMILVAMMHVNPELKPEEAIEAGREWARKVWMPNMKHLWRDQAVRINRHGVRAEASKIRRELYKLL